MTGNTMPFHQDTAAEIEQLRSALQAANVGTWDYNILTGEAQWSAICKQLFGLPSDAEVTAAILLAQVHPDDQERVAQANLQAMSPLSDGTHDITFRTMNPGGGQRWVQAKGRVARNEQEQPVRFSGIVSDVTESVMARQQNEQVQQQVLSQFEQSPVGLATISADELTFRMVNPFYGQLVGRSPEELIGKPLLEAMPELRGQGFDALLEQVIRTNIPYTALEVAVNIVRRDQLDTIYVDLTYQPQQSVGEGGSGVLVIAIDVTSQVLARHKIEESEAALRNAIDLAKLGTWRMEVATGQMTYSDRLKNWLGVQDAVLDGKASPRVHPKDQDRISRAIEKALETGGNGWYDEVYTITNATTGQEHIIHANGQAVFDASGVAVSLFGTAQDVTIQQELQLALTNQVQQHTQELAATNKALAIINEELAANNEALQAANRANSTINDELADSNALLTRSNESLQQFAYVASHDLQEPLRKIQQFGDILKTKYSDQLGEGVDYLNRMQSAASRMSTLIRDLLAFSRISTRRENSQEISLTKVVNAVLTDLELAILEAGAIISVDALPTVFGDASQLSQLFSNLLSNALKFRRPGFSPVIAINTHLVAEANLPSGIKPGNTALLYHCIVVSDNGIGFDEKYTDRIFQVFQRLHGKREYAGTGIGLAICEKVISNHGGAITATSQLGQGATFSVYLPV